MIVNEGGKKLPKLTTPGTSADLLTGKQLIDQYGNVVDGSMPINTKEAPRFLATELESYGRITATALYNDGYYDGGGFSNSYTLSSDDDPNFIPENILFGKSVFGINGVAPGFDSLGNGVELHVSSSGQGSFTGDFYFDTEKFPEQYIPKKIEDLGTFVAVFANNYSMYGGKPFGLMAVYKKEDGNILFSYGTDCLDQSVDTSGINFGATVYNGKLVNYFRMPINNDCIQYPYVTEILGLYIPKF